MIPVAISDCASSGSAAALLNRNALTMNSRTLSAISALRSSSICMSPRFPGFVALSLDVRCRLRVLTSMGVRQESREPLRPASIVAPMALPEPFPELLDRLQRELVPLPDKPEETPETTLRALWCAAAGRPSSAEVAASAELAPLEPEGLAELERLIALRLAGTPLAHLTGRQSFMGVELLAGPEALVPRKETEILAGVAIGRLDPSVPATVLDVCTGSGNLAAAIALARPLARIQGRGSLAVRGGTGLPEHGFRRGRRPGDGDRGATSSALFPGRPCRAGRPRGLQPPVHLLCARPGDGARDRGPRAAAGLRRRRFRFDDRGVG